MAGFFGVPGVDGSCPFLEPVELFCLFCPEGGWVPDGLFVEFLELFWVFDVSVFGEGFGWVNDPAFLRGDFDFAQCCSRLVLVVHLIGCRWLFPSPRGMGSGSLSGMFVLAGSLLFKNSGFQSSGLGD